MVTDRDHATGERATLTVYCDHGHEDRPLLWGFERVAAELGEWEWVDSGRENLALFGADPRADRGMYRFDCDRCGLAVEGDADAVDSGFDRLASRGIRRIALDRLRAVVGAWRA